MSTNSPKVTRSELVSTVTLPPSRWAKAVSLMRSGDTWLRIGLCLLAIALAWVSTGSWEPPFRFRRNYTPRRNIVARVAFERDDNEATQIAREDARRNAICVYENDSKRLVQLQDGLRHKVSQLVATPSFEDVDQELWNQFLPDDPDQSLNESQSKAAFDAFQQALADDARQSQLETALTLAFSEIQKHGLLVELGHGLYEGNQGEITVHPEGDVTIRYNVEVEDVLSANAATELHERLVEQLQMAALNEGEADQVAQRLYTWLNRGLADLETLSLDKDQTNTAREQAAERVEMLKDQYQPGILLVTAGQPLTDDQLSLLRLEHQEALRQLSLPQRLQYALASLAMYFAVCFFCGFYIYRRDFSLLRDLHRLSTLLGFSAATIIICRLASWDQWQAELTPLLIFGMTASIVYRQELAVLLVSSLSVIIVFTLGLRLTDYAVFIAATSATVFLTGRIRTRTRLIYVGLWTGLVAGVTSLAVGLLVGQTLGGPLLWDAARYALCSVLAGLLMTGLLPFIEKLFDIHTDLSLLELGDAAHPLLQELARRAPGTYNHSISVASLAETAAEAIGANGLLVRVGAYFHDIGKMLKPVYFVENQGTSASRHESLVPAMSTLVIIAHVKDGADLARQHHLPDTIVDFIEQHHGTTLVEYFYNEEAKRRELNPDEGQIDETSFRYPGPKPQTRESGVMMLADAVESASRTLVDPTPARIESLVREIAMKRLLDGQFDECGLTLSELRNVQDSLAKSLTAVYHGRVKYPSQQQSA